MLNKYMLAAGTLLAASFVASAPATASSHRNHRVVAHGTHVGARLGRSHVGLARAGRARAFVGARGFARGRVLARGRAYGRGRFAAGAGHRYASLRHGHLHIARRYTRLARHGRGRFVASVDPDDMIRNLVGPSSAYTPATSGGQVGGASYYSGGRTASGGVVGAATCAHRSLPFGTRVLVTNLNNARQAVLTVNDRGPFIGGRIIDVSRGAAGTLGMLGAGVARVSVKVIGGPG